MTDSSWRQRVFRCMSLQAFFETVLQNEVAQMILNLLPGSVISLASGINWFGDETASNECYIRQCYPELRTARNQYILARGWAQKPGISLFTGTPGIGKTYFGGIWCCEALIQGRPLGLEIVISDSDRQLYWVSTKGQVEYTQDIGDFLSRLQISRTEGENPLYVVDGGAPSLDGGTFSGEAVVFASPNKDLKRRINKAEKILTFFVPTFDRKGLVACKNSLSCFKDMSDEDLFKWYQAAGGSARICLVRGHILKQSIDEDFLPDVRDALNSMKLPDILQVGKSGFPHGSDKIFHCHVGDSVLKPGRNSPEDENLRQYTRMSVRFASELVANMAMSALTSKARVELAISCLTSEHEQNSATAAGYWFEHLALSRIQDGGTFDVAVLPDSPKGERTYMKLTVPRTTRSCWASLQQGVDFAKLDLSVLSVPYSKRQAGIDAILSPCTFLQATSASKHSLLRSAVEEVARATNEVAGGRTKQLAGLKKCMSKAGNASMPALCGKPVLIFVVPSGCYDDSYKVCQPYRSTHARPDGPEGPQKALVHQMVLKLPIEQYLGKSTQDLEGVQMFMDRLCLTDAAASGSA